MPEQRGHSADNSKHFSSSFFYRYNSSLSTSEAQSFLLSFHLGCGHVQRSDCFGRISILGSCQQVRFASVEMPGMQSADCRVTGLSLDQLDIDHYDLWSVAGLTSSWSYLRASRISDLPSPIEDLAWGLRVPWPDCGSRNGFAFCSSAMPLSHSCFWSWHGLDSHLLSRYR